MRKRETAKRTPSPERYINRELSWLNFNNRVLFEASNPANPLLERLKFLTIFESNLDEFYMVRVSGLIEQYEAGLLERTPDGMTPAEQLQLIADTAKPMRKQAWRIFDKGLRQELEAVGIRILSYENLSKGQRAKLSKTFAKEIFPVCTPLALQPAHKLPFISNRSLNLAVQLSDKEGGQSLARLKIPPILPRLYRPNKRKSEFVLLEDIVANNLASLFPGMKVEGSYTFRVLRDADIEIQELEAADLISTVEQTIRMRRFGEPVMLEVSSAMPKSIRKFLMSMHILDDTGVFVVDGIQGFDAFGELAQVEKPELRYKPFLPRTSDALASSDMLFQEIRKHDILVHHPFDSFRCVEEFVASAAKDPDVLAIKQTLYRVGSPSPIVESLLAAAEAGKQVAAMVELKARFDESNNLVWARALERAGAHVTYGFAEMKTHCKLSLVVRREGSQIRRYAHVSTGNYNPLTSRLYTDIGLFTVDEAITQDISELFNALTAFSRQDSYRKLLVAPLDVRDGIIERIHREIAAHKQSGDGRIIFKANALVDPEVIDALYEASNAGVTCDLIIRGICCLRPGVPGLSELIRVQSIIGRFLEHSRVYYFRNGGAEDVLIGSADMMRRNLDRRVEVLAPVEDACHIRTLRDFVLDAYLRDDANCWCMKQDGSYERPKKATFSAQLHFITTAPPDGITSA